MPLCLAVLNGQAPQPRSSAPKAQGLTAVARTERQLSGPRRFPKPRSDVLSVAGSSFDLPEVTAFSSRFEADCEFACQCNARLADSNALGDAYSQALSGHHSAASRRNMRLAAM
jgi:hypothetical protein